jgi:hypothetical protein
MIFFWSYYDSVWGIFSCSFRLSTPGDLHCREMASSRGDHLAMERVVPGVGVERTPSHRLLLGVLHSAAASAAPARWREDARRRPPQPRLAW